MLRDGHPYNLVILSEAKNLDPRVDGYRIAPNESILESESLEWIQNDKIEDTRGTRFFASLRMTQGRRFAYPKHKFDFATVLQDYSGR
jgi:hypothetical protein